LSFLNNSIWMNKFFLAILSLICAGHFSMAQIEGDSLFSTNQVITIELNFSQPGYWDSLVNNYASSSYMAADMTITTMDVTRSFNNIAVRFKGNSTYNHPNNKKPFKIDFNKYVPGQNFDGIKKINLSNGFKDPSCMREKLFFDFCHDAGVNAPRANFVNLYINGSLLGFYTMVEQIDDQFLDWAILDDNGNLFKAGDNFGPGGGTAADLMYYGSLTSDYTDRYELKTNEIINDWSDLISLIDFINNSTDSDFATNFSVGFEQQELLRSFAIDNLFGNLDSYTGSARNYYLYHNLTTNKWEWIKWDANEAFGSYTNQQVPVSLDLEYYNPDRPLLSRIFENATLNYAYKVEICNLLETYFNNAYLDPQIDDLYNLIKQDVYADNNKMYSNTDFDNNIQSDIIAGGGPMGGGVIYGLKSFVNQRISNINNQIDCADYAGMDDFLTSQLLIYPNPSEGSFEISASNGFGFEKIELRNSLGQLVYEETFSIKSNCAISLSFLKKGIYYLTVGKDNLFLQQKVIID
jgi:hypothetical protein